MWYPAARILALSPLLHYAGAELAQLRHGFMTVAPALPLLQRQQFTCPAGNSACTDGGCCPIGAKCTSTSGIPLCADICGPAAQVCTYGDFQACCPEQGLVCDYDTPGYCTPGINVPPPLGETSMAGIGPLPTGPIATVTPPGGFTTTAMDEPSPTQDSYTLAPLTSGPLDSPTAQETTSQQSTDTATQTSVESLTAAETTSMGSSTQATDSASTQGTAETTTAGGSAGHVVNVRFEAVFGTAFGLVVALWLM